MATAVQAKRKGKFQSTQSKDEKWKILLPVNVTWHRGKHMDIKVRWVKALSSESIIIFS